jgi:hypothetical protein
MSLWWSFHTSPLVSKKMVTLIPNMTTKTIVSDKGNKYIIPVVSAEEMEQIMFGMDSPGWCLTCGEEVDGVEPDASKYLCECCGQRKVYGMEQLLIMDLLVIK